MRDVALFVTFGDFGTPTDGGSKFTREVIELMRLSELDVEIFSYYDWSSIKHKFLRKIASMFVALLLRLPLPVSYFYSDNLRVAIINRARELLGEPCRSIKKLTIFIDHLELCYLAVDLRKVFGEAVEIVHISHNIEPALFQQRMGGKGLYKYSQLCCVYSDFEKEALSHVDRIYSISDEERHHYSLLNPVSSFGTSIKTITIPPVFSYASKLEGNSRLSHKKLVFLASFDWWPNLQAFQWIRDCLAPRLSSEFKIHVYGKNSKKYSFGAPENMVFHGYVTDIMEVWDNCFFSIAPIVQGAGVNIKVAESLHNKIPVIGTKVSFGGISEVYLKGSLELELNADKWVAAMCYYSNSSDEYEKLKGSISYPSVNDVLEQLRRCA
ncbi:glycosyltransferase [Pseudomonas sp. MBLB4136]|uniref:glycosyltransferase n=1 Tax=Pseudomonas sp. MBLB4136 TaxID=3451558 RepID=UPI003F7515F8